MEREWTEQPCWTCKLACGSCPWSELDPNTKQIRFQPIPGWDAEAVVYDSNGVKVQTYKIYSCPMKEEEPPREIDHKAFEQMVLDCIVQYSDDGLSASEIAEQMDLPRKVVYRYIQKAREDGRL